MGYVTLYYGHEKDPPRENVVRDQIEVKMKRCKRKRDVTQQQTSENSC